MYAAIRFQTLEEFRRRNIKKTQLIKADPG